MMKRILLILLALLLLCMPAGAEELYQTIDNALYTIILRTETADVTLGTGIVYQQQSLLLTALACCREGDLYAVGKDGEHAITRWTGYESAGLALLEMASPAAVQPVTGSNADTRSLAMVFGVTDQGQTGAMPLYMARMGMYHGNETMVLASEEGLLPGAFMMDDKGRLVAMVVAQHAESVGSYVAMDADVIRRTLNDGAQSLFLESSFQWVEGMVDVSWKDAARNGGKYIVTVSGASNLYYTTYTADVSQRSLYLALAPGHTYYIQVQWVKDGANELPPDWSVMKTFTVPETHFSSYCFEQSCYLASVPAGQEAVSPLPEMLQLTAATLTDPAKDVYLQIRNTYDVVDEFEVAMTMELLTPSGQFFYEEMGYTFAPEYELDDSFAVPVDELLINCMQFSGGKLTQGEYVLRYSLAGRIAGEFAFVIVE